MSEVKKVTIGILGQETIKAYEFGIDYGMGMTNIDLETGIRFGVISVHDLPFFYDEAEPEYPEFDPVEYGLEADEEGEFDEEELEEELENARQNFYEYAEPLAWGIVSPDCIMAHSQNDCDVFVTKSKFFTYARLCSPCAPGACYLTSQTNENGFKAYCPSPDMFKEGACPIDIYSIETGLLVIAKTEEEG